MIDNMLFIECQPDKTVPVDGWSLGLYQLKYYFIYLLFEIINDDENVKV